MHRNVVRRPQRWRKSGSDHSLSRADGPSGSGSKGRVEFIERLGVPDWADGGASQIVQEAALVWLEGHLSIALEQRDGAADRVSPHRRDRSRPSMTRSPGTTWPVAAGHAAAAGRRFDGPAVRGRQQDCNPVGRKEISEVPRECGRHLVAPSGRQGGKELGGGRRDAHHFVILRDATVVPWRRQVSWASPPRLAPRRTPWRACATSRRRLR